MSPPDLAAALVTRLNLKDQLLAVYPQLAEDEQTLLDSLDGLDTLNEQIVAVLRHAIEREAHGKALAELIEAMTARKRRLEDGAKSLRATALHAMREANIPKIAAADMTIGVSPGKPRLVITDEAAVPENLCRIKREPDRKAIAEYLKERPNLMPNWAAWDAPRPFLQIHKS